MNFVNAEVCKIAVNTFVTTKISYANMLAELCDHLEGADVDVDLGRARSRHAASARNISTAALPTAGPASRATTRRLRLSARSLGVPLRYRRGDRQINDHQVQRLFGAVAAERRAGARVAVLGLSYKPHTGGGEESGHGARAAAAGRGIPGRRRGSALGRGGGAVLGETVEVAETSSRRWPRPMSAVITTPWPAIRDLAHRRLRQPVGPMPVVDPWGLLKDTPSPSSHT